MECNNSCNWERIITNAFQKQNIFNPFGDKDLVLVSFVPRKQQKALNSNRKITMWRMYDFQNCLKMLEWNHDSILKIITRDWFANCSCSLVVSDLQLVFIFQRISNFSSGQFFRRLLLNFTVIRF